MENEIEQMEQNINSQETMIATENEPSLNWRQRLNPKRWWQNHVKQKLTRGEKIAAWVILVIFLLVFYITLDANKYAAQVRTIEGEGKVGVNPTTERLDFGDLSRGTSAVRTVTVKNGTIMPMYVVMVKTGSIADLVDININYLKLPRGAEQKIEFQTYIPASAAINATYKGRVYLFKIPTFWL